jgi:hypothetical protein
VLLTHIEDSKNRHRCYVARLGFYADTPAKDNCSYRCNAVYDMTVACFASTCCGHIETAQWNQTESSVEGNFRWCSATCDKNHSS